MNSIRGMTSSLAYFIAWSAKLLIWCLTICCYYCLVVKLCQLFAIPWSVALQVLLSMGFLRQEYWSGLHFLLQGIFLTQGSPATSALAGRFFTTGKLYHLGNLDIVIVNFMCQLYLFSVPGYLSNSVSGVSVEAIFRWH